MSVDPYYTPLIGDRPIEVRNISDTKGRGVFATRDIELEEVLMLEEPIVSCQYYYNKQYFPACAHCIKSLETAQEMTMRLANYEETPAFVEAATKQELNLIKLKCPHCDDEIYCSERCQEQAWNMYHSRLCLGRSPSEDHPLQLLTDIWKQTHYPPETATIFLLARMIVLILKERESSRKSGGKAADQIDNDQFRPFERFHMQYYSKNLDAQHKFLADQFKDNVSAMREFMKAALYVEGSEDVFSEEGFDSLFCLMCLNSQGVGTSSLEQYEIALSELGDTPEVEQALDYLAGIQDDIEEHSGQFTHAEGSALYRLHSCLNHNCEPNAEARFPFNSATVQVVATRPIKAGEEICLSYLECVEELDFSERQKVLRDFYLFECDCARCVAEAAADSSSKKKKKKKKNNKKK